MTQVINLTSFALVFVSALAHPLWNLLLKKSEDKVVFYMNIHLFFTVFFSFLLFVYPVKNVTTEGWVLVALSSLSHFAYQVFLCRTYEAGDLSLTYPVARSSPVFVLAFAFIFLKETPSTAAVAGTLLIVGGAYLINWKNFHPLNFLKPLERPHATALAFACFTALWSAVYSVVDKKGSLAMEPVLFFYLFFAISGLMFAAYLFFLDGRRRKRYITALRRDKYRIALASTLEFISYVLILFAFRLSKVGYVVALRQVSVIFGAVYGVVLLKEHYGKVRIAASIVIFLGAFLIIVFG